MEPFIGQLPLILLLLFQKFLVHGLKFKKCIAFSGESVTNLAKNVNRYVVRGVKRKRKRYRGREREKEI